MTLVTSTSIELHASGISDTLRFMFSAIMRRIAVSGDALVLIGPLGLRLGGGLPGVDIRLHVFAGHPPVVPRPGNRGKIDFVEFGQSQDGGGVTRSHSPDDSARRPW